MRDKDEARTPSEGITDTQVNPVIVVVATAVVVVLMFIGAYAAGRSATKPTDSPEYRALVSDIADVKKRTAANKARAKELTGEVEQLEEKQQAADKRLEEAKQAYQRYVPAGSVTDQPLTVESLDVAIVPDEIRTGTYVHPKFVVRNTSGHIIIKIEIVGDIVRTDGTVVSADQFVSADDIRLMPGRTAVIEKNLIAGAAAGDLFKPKHYYYQAASDSQSKDVQFGGDVTAKVIS